MKNQWILGLGMVTGLVGWTGAVNQDDDIIIDQETELADLRAEVEELSEKIDNSERVMRETIAYLEALGKTASSMESTLSEAEKAGFTAGINPRSREVLLAGWRKQLGQLQKGVPSLEKKDSGKGNNPRYPKRWK